MIEERSPAEAVGKAEIQTGRESTSHVLDSQSARRILGTLSAKCWLPTPDAARRAARAHFLRDKVDDRGEMLAGMLQAGDVQSVGTTRIGRCDRQAVPNIAMQIGRTERLSPQRGWRLMLWRGGEGGLEQVDSADARARRRRFREQHATPMRALAVRPASAPKKQATRRVVRCEGCAKERQAAWSR